MLEQINKVKEQGFKPVIYIDNTLAKTESLFSLVRVARSYNIPVFYESNIVGLNRLHKAHVYRYGALSQITAAMVKKKGGVIVSGNL